MKKRISKYMALFLAGAIAIGAVGCKKEDAASDTDGSGAAVVDITNEEIPKTTEALQTAFVLAENPPTIAAKAAILVEQSTGTILFEKESKGKMYPASMTKMLTALVTLDHFSPDELVTVGTEINEVSLDSSKAGHVLGETLTVKNLIRGLIIPSGNDSANVLATAVARRTEKNESLSFSQSEAIFADLLNKKAEELGAVNSHFTNAHGYHDENHYSCAYDMALFATQFMNNSTLVEIANERSFSGNGADNMFAEDAAMKTQDYNWRSHNLLITDNEYNYGYASGIKTGFTNEAGACVASAAKKDDTTLIAIVFHSEDPNRWLDSKNLFEYGFNSYQKYEFGKKDGQAVTVALTKQNRLEGDTLELVFGENTATYLPQGTETGLTMRESIDEAYRVEKNDGSILVKAPIKKGEKVGTVSYELNGKTVLTKDVYAGRDVAKSTLWSNIKYFFKNFVSIVFSVKGLIGLVIIAVIVIIILLLMKLRNGRNRRGRGGMYTFRTPPKRRRRGGGRRF